MRGVPVGRLHSQAASPAGASPARRDVPAPGRVMGRHAAWPLSSWADGSGAKGRLTGPLSGQRPHESGQGLACWRAAWSWLREVIPSLGKIWRRWAPTVRCEM